MTWDFLPSNTILTDSGVSILADAYVEWIHIQYDFYMNVIWICIILFLVFCFVFALFYKRNSLW